MTSDDSKSEEVAKGRITFQPTALSIKCGRINMKSVKFHSVLQIKYKVQTVNDSRDRRGNVT